MIATIRPSRPVLRYHGGKFLSADRIIGYFPPHRIYIEPYAGAASVLMQKPRSYAEVYNDRWGTVVNVFRVLRDPVQACELERLLRLTPFARDEFAACGEADMAAITDPVERARRTILRSFAGFGSAATNAAHTTGFRANSHRSGTTPAMDWARYPNHIPSFTARLRGVVIENRPAVEVIRQHDRSDTLIYADPCYPHSTRNLDAGQKAYFHEMTDDDHRELAEVLHNVQGMVVLSGYACDLYDRELYPDWRREEFSALADGGRRRTEALWLNPAADRALGGRLF